MAHIVESFHPEGILIEVNHEWVSLGARERLSKCKETGSRGDGGWGNRGAKKKDYHQKK